MTMTKKNTKTVAKIDDVEIATNENTLCVANVARELKIDPKRARSYLRKHANDYNDFRNKRFTRESSLYAKCHEMLTTYKNKNRVIND